MKKLKIHYFVIFLQLLILISTLTLVFPVTLQNSIINASETDSLKISANEINIITPENKSYSHMSGYYSGIYGFENDAPNSNPMGWNTTEPPSTSVNVINEMDNHKRVVQLTDNNAAGFPIINQSINSLTSGIIEFWIRAGETNRQHYFQISDDANNGIHLYMMQVGNWRYVTAGPVYNIIETYNANQWYHVKIEFNTTKFHLWIDGISKDGGAGYDLAGSPTSFKKIAFNTDYGETGGDMWIDAIGYSWDSDYNIGDNLNEGLLLSFENSTVLDWTGYSLDGQVNKTVLGNSTIPMPSKGLHTIQVYGNNTIGDIFQSSLRYFSVSYLNIITPENKIYDSSMNGYYPGIYGFENDAPNSYPMGWNTTEPPSTSVNVINEIDNHKRVVHLTDNNAAGYPIINQSIGSRTSGIIEFWIRVGETDRSHYISISSDTGDGIHLYMQYLGNWRYVTPGPVYNIIETYNANQWYHVKIEFNTTKFHLWIDGVSKDGGVGYGLSGSTSSFKKIVFNTDYSQTGGDMWIDAIGYSWDSGYDIGDNLNEGLLLSFESGKNLEWMGYSLNGQQNKTILGNTTLTFPSDGSHQIQVFGNDSIGTMYQSNFKYFTVDTIAPTSLISFTQYGDPNIVIKSTAFTIIADDGLGSGISLIRYRINNTGWNDYNSTFDLSNYDSGYYMIYYYSIDNAGNIELENSVSLVLINISDKPSISGYTTTLLIISFCGVIVLIIQKKYKN